MLWRRSGKGVCGVGMQRDVELMHLHMYVQNRQSTPAATRRPTTLRYRLTFPGSFWDLEPAGITSTAMVPSLCSRLTRSKSDGWIGAAVDMVFMRQMKEISLERLGGFMRVIISIKRSYVILKREEKVPDLSWEEEKKKKNERRLSEKVQRQ